MAPHENEGYRRLFGGDGLSFGLFFPITPSDEPIPPMDVPLYWPKFRDAGQVYDPWVYLAHVATQVDGVALATGSIVLPVRHPLHVAKAAASVDRLSGGRLVLGVASGDRPPEFPAFGVDGEARGERFRESVRVLRAAWSEEFPEVESVFEELDGSLDVVPKPTTGALPLLVTGRARQSLDWIAEHGDGWLHYQLPLPTLESVVADWRAAVDGTKPFAQSMRVNLDPDPAAGMDHVHGGYEAGSEWFTEHVRARADRGVDHLAISVRGCNRDVRTVLEEFADDVIARV